MGRIVGIVFFLALGFAALTSCVSVMETLVANCMEIFHKSRKEMCAMVGVYSLVTAVTICLGYNVFYFELTLPNGSARSASGRDGLHQQPLCGARGHADLFLTSTGFWNLLFRH